MRSWNDFLSCDARDMCLVGPAMMRNVLAFLALLVRPVFLGWQLSYGSLLVVDVGMWEWFVADVHWASRTEDADFQEFQRIRDEAARLRERYREGAVSRIDARTAALAIAERAWAWRERTRHGQNLVLLREEAFSDCDNPFDVSLGGVAILFERRDDYDCDYLVLMK